MDLLLMHELTTLVYTSSSCLMIYLVRSSSNHLNTSQIKWYQIKTRTGGSQGMRPAGMYLADTTRGLGGGSFRDDTFEPSEAKRDNKTGRKRDACRSHAPASIVQILIYFLLGCG